MQKFFHHLWFRKNVFFYLLLPLSICYGMIVQIRRWLYIKGILKSYKAPIPILVVGNLTVGGNGKTPVVIWIVKTLKEMGIKTAVISRGYGANPPSFPFEVNNCANPMHTGDEPLLIAERTKVPVIISPNRQQAITYILQKEPLTQIIISDDGLQHYAMKRDIEWVVVDATKQFGNRHYLPAGPMRERLSRLANVNAVVINNGSNPTPSDINGISSHPITTQLYLKPLSAINLKTGESKELTDFGQVNAIAGIGFPERFYNTLEKKGLHIVKKLSFNDHHAFTPNDFFAMEQSIPLLMTEKDAIKCRCFALANWWYVPIDSFIPVEDSEKLLKQIKEIL